MLTSTLVALCSLVIVTNAFVSNARGYRMRSLCMSDNQFDYDLIIVGCGVGGHGASRGVGAVRQFQLSCVPPTRAVSISCW